MQTPLREQTSSLWTEGLSFPSFKGLLSFDPGSQKLTGSLEPVASGGAGMGLWKLSSCCSLAPTPHAKAPGGLRAGSAHRPLPRSSVHPFTPRGSELSTCCVPAVALGAVAVASALHRVVSVAPSPRSTACGPAARQAFRLGFGCPESGTLFSQNCKEEPAGPLPPVSPPQTSPRSPPFTWGPSLQNRDSFPGGAGADTGHQGLGDLALPDTQVRGRLRWGRGSLLLPLCMCLERGRSGEEAPAGSVRTTQGLAGLSGRGHPVWIRSRGRTAPTWKAFRLEASFLR